MTMIKQVAQINGTEFELVQYASGNAHITIALGTEPVGDILEQDMQEWIREIVAATKRPMPKKETLASVS